MLCTCTWLFQLEANFRWSSYCGPGLHICHPHIVLPECEKVVSRSPELILLLHCSSTGRSDLVLYRLPGITKPDNISGCIPRTINSMLPPIAPFSRVSLSMQISLVKPKDLIFELWDFTDFLNCAYWNVTGYVSGTGSVLVFRLLPKHVTTWWLFTR